MAVHENLPSEPTKLFYYLEVADGGIIQTYPGTAFEKRRKHVPHDVRINDMRSVRDDFTLDKSGFELINHKTAVQDFSNDEEVKAKYYPEVRDIIKKYSGASEVHIVSHMCRKSTFAEAQDDAKIKGDKEFVTKNNPARFVHVDQSYRGSEQILFLNLPEEEAEQKIKKRWAIMNVWQPFEKAVKKDPLAFCDFRSVDEKDFRTVVANLPPPGAGEYGNVSKNLKHNARAEYSSNGDNAAVYEVTNMAYNPNQKWYYASDMTPEEAWVFKIFDSKNDGRAKCAVHSSFPLRCSLFVPVASPLQYHHIKSDPGILLHIVLHLPIPDAAMPPCTMARIEDCPLTNPEPNKDDHRQSRFKFPSRPMSLASSINTHTAPL